MNANASEFDVIARYFTRPAAGAVLGVGDDCALLLPRPGSEIAVSTDTLVAGVHFLADTDARNLGHKTLAVNLSDLAAMGATPRWFLLALTLPGIDHAWLQRFSLGLFSLADESGIALVGGDTTRGPLSMTLTVIGEVDEGRALRRDTARDGDDIWVSGELGAAALGLRCLRRTLQISEPHRGAAISRLERPDARVRLGMHLCGTATAAIDVSDGLLADLGHICARSGLAAQLDWHCVPVARALAACTDEALQRDCALAGGDDYELCFTAPAEARASVAQVAAVVDLQLTRIGTMRAGSGVSISDRNGYPVKVSHAGFDHFAET